MSLLHRCSTVTFTGAHVGCDAKHTFCGAYSHEEIGDHPVEGPSVQYTDNNPAENGLITSYGTATQMAVKCVRLYTNPSRGAME